MKRLIETDEDSGCNEMSDKFNRELACLLHGHIMERLGDCGDGDVMFQCYRCAHTVIIPKWPDEKGKDEKEYKYIRLDDYSNEKQKTKRFRRSGKSWPILG